MLAVANATTSVLITLQTAELPHACHFHIIAKTMIAFTCIPIEAQHPLQCTIVMNISPMYIQTNSVIGHTVGREVKMAGGIGSRASGMAQTATLLLVCTLSEAACCACWPHTRHPTEGTISKDTDRGI